MNLYDILKTSKLGAGAAPDMYTALRAQAMRGKEYSLSGIPPLTFTSNGSPLVSWSIKGNTVQSGTPSPSNPVDVNGTGERTENLFDGNYEFAYMVNSANAVYYDNISNVRTALIPCKPDTKYTIKRFEGGNRLRVACYATKPTNNTTGELLYNSNSETNVTITTSSTAAYLAVYVAEVSSASEIILTSIVEGETIPTDYEPYGYKIPILTNSMTTPVYLGEVQTVRQIKKLVLTGEESWERQSGQSADYFRISNMPAIPSKVLCTHYISPDENIAYLNTVTGIKMQQSASYGVILVCRPTNVSTLADFKNYLATQYSNGTPVTIWYVLATPQTAVVNEPLMKIGDYADELSNAVSIPTVRGENTLSVGTTVQPSEMTIKYYK